MKKALAILLIAAAAAVLSSCGYMYTPSSSNASSAASSSAASSLLPESSEEPKEPEYLAVGDACTVGDWEITISSVAMQERVDTSATLYYEADEGNQYIVVGMTLTNNGTKADTAFPMISFGNSLDATLYYQDEYEYSQKYLISLDEDLHDKSVAPLSTASGVLVFSVPDAVATSSDPLILQIDEGLMKSAEYQIK